MWRNDRANGARQRKGGDALGSFGSGATLGPVDEQHRKWRRARHAFRDTAEDKTLKPVAAVASHHDQGRVPTECLVEDQLTDGLAPLFQKGRFGLDAELARGRDRPI